MCIYIYICFIDCGGNIRLWKSQIIFVIVVLAGECCSRWYLPLYGQETWCPGMAGVRMSLELVSEGATAPAGVKECALPKLPCKHIFVVCPEPCSPGWPGHAPASVETHSQTPGGAWVALLASLI